ncbi:hypothetical protein M8J76_003537 [Diaphorina citri]|nr:hypothetical protein M8J75_000608 [Diaphorina citri]KAI5716256.1 hypothetical protein M8J76_003537 [Diaphorina citri]
MKLHAACVVSTLLLSCACVNPAPTTLSSSEEKFQQRRAKMVDKMNAHEEKIKEIRAKLVERDEKRRQALIKKGKITTPYGLNAVQDPDYFLITQPPNSAELRQHAIDQAAMDRLKDEVYNDDVKWPPMSDGGDMKNGTMPTEHFDWPDESKELTFFEKYYSWKTTKFPTTPDTTLDGLIHPFDNPEHPDFTNADIAYNKYYRYKSDEIAFYNRKYNLTLSKDMFTPPQPFVTGFNMSDWFNWANMSHIAKVFAYTLDYNTLKANYMKYERIRKNLELPRLQDHLKNSTWCFICGDTFSHPRDRMTHVTVKHYQYGDYGQDRLSDPNWTWKENIQIYRRPTLLPEYYEEYVHPDHLTMDISFDHYAYWDAKRKAGEINFPNRPDCVTTTAKVPADRKRWNEIRHELRHFIWMPPKTDKN